MHQYEFIFLFAESFVVALECVLLGVCVCVCVYVCVHICMCDQQTSYSRDDSIERDNIVSRINYPFICL